MVKIHVQYFAVRRAARAVPRDDHLSQLEGVTPPVWQLMPCKREGKIQVDSCELDCRGLTFVPPDGASHLLGQPRLNIAAASRIPPTFLLSAWIQRGAQLDTVCIHWELDGSLRGTHGHGPLPVRYRGRGATLRSSSAPLPAALPGGLFPPNYVYAWLLRS